MILASRRLSRNHTVIYCHVADGEGERPAFFRERLGFFHERLGFFRERPGFSARSRDFGQSMTVYDSKNPNFCILTIC